MPTITTSGVLKPSAGTYLYGRCEYTVSHTDTVTTVRVTSYAYSDASIQNGVACAPYHSTPLESAPAATGVTNRTAQIAKSTYTWLWARKASAYTVYVGTKIWGTTVSGYSGYTNGSTTGSASSPLAKVQANISVPALPAAGKPTCSVAFGGTSSSATATIYSSTVSGAASYVYEYRYTTVSGTTDWLTAPASHQVSMANNRAYQFRVGAVGYNGVTNYSTAVPSGGEYTTPTAPSGLSASASGTSVKLSWATNALRATTVQIQRATNSAFTTGVATIYNGAAKKTHTDSYSGGTVYYRVRAVAPGGTTGWSNVASAITMLAPAAVTGVARTGTVNSNNIVLTWVNHPSSPTRPYSNINFISDDNASFSSPSEVDIAGTDATDTFTGAAKKRYWFRIVPENAAGRAPVVTVGPYSTTTPAAVLSGMKATKSKVSITTNTTGQNWGISGVVNTHSLQYRFMPVGGSYGAWTQFASFTGNVTRTDTYTAASRGSVQLRCVTTTTGLDGGNRTATATNGEVDVEFAPLAPTLISFTNNTVSINIPADDVGATTRAVRLYLDGALKTTWNVNGSKQTLTYSYTPTKVLTKATANIQTAFSASPSTTVTFNIDLDKAPVSIGGKRYAVFTVASNGTVTACSTQVIR